MSRPRIVLVRYDEIGLKGKNRSFFESRLIDHIRRKLADMEGVRYRRPRGRILVDIDETQVDECVRRLRMIPGIVSFSVGVPIRPDVDSIAELGIQWIEPLLASGKPLTFYARTQRSDKTFPITSPDFSYQVGAKILQKLHDKGLSAEFKTPEFVLEIEIGHEETVAFQGRVPGIRGLPVSSGGEVLTLLSGGIDSPVAAFMVIRRGCRSHFVFFDNQAFLGRGGFDKTHRLAKIVNRYQWGGRLCVVPFGNLQTAIRDLCTPAHRVVLYRRMMYRIAHALAEKYGCLALVTGESIGQVASQTLENLAAVSCTVPLSVFRPLIGMDKKDIIDEAKKIGTYDVSIEPHPDCCSVFMPPNPAIRSKVDQLEADEERYPWKDLMREAIENMQVFDLDRS
ncbi:MAG: tRNA 4-thiouridine(8) synthase ThiI [Nitrospinae bacterium]|nr:tRNA 4-thiouridine(8) synthase ThiI [Nitrospinota bacterium]